MTRIEKQKKVIEKMIRIYCADRHATSKDCLCDECRDLIEYAHKRLTYCRYGESKTSCRKCPTHCYAPAYREKVRVVMRTVGPTMIWRAPLDAIRHLFS